LKEGQDKRHQLDLERSQAVRDDHAVPPEVLFQARRERSDSWMPLRTHMLGTEKLEQPEVPVRAFEELVTRADELADQRFMAAERSGRLVALTEELERLDLNIKSGEKRV